MRADDDPGPPAGDRADDVAQPGLAGDRLEVAAGQAVAQLRRQPAQLRRAGGALAVGELELDQVPRPVRVEAVDAGGRGRLALGLGRPCTTAATATPAATSRATLTATKARTKTQG